MMGSNDRLQDELFYTFNLEDIVSQDHLLRDIDRVLDLSELREHLAPYYSHTGRPSVDPHASYWLLLRDPLRTSAVLRSDDEPGVPLIL